MRDALKSYLALAGGLTDVTKQRATAAAKALVAQGEATAEQVSTLAEDLLQQSKSNREAVAALVKYEVDRTLGRVGLATNDEVHELTQRIRALEAQLREATARTGGGGTGGGGAADAGPAKKAADAPAKKAAPATKAAAKKKTPTKKPGA